MGYKNNIFKNCSRIILSSPFLIILFTLFPESILAEEKLNKDRYPASFFDQYLPQNALQMVERLPGFNLNLGDNNRGFGANAGNVLIDGVRPSTKTGGLFSILNRIPAAQVDYIEILRGGVSAGETSGQSVVANVVRKKNGTSGRWSAIVRRAPDGKLSPNIEAAINTNLGDWKTAFDTDIGGMPGYRTALIERRDEDGMLLNSADEKFTHRKQWISINGEGSRNLLNGLLTLNARTGASEGEFSTTRDIFLAQLPDGSLPDQQLVIEENTDNQIKELSIDWLGTTDNWKLHLLGLGVSNDESYANTVRFRNFSNLTSSISNFSQDSEKTEIIARATYGFVGKDNFKPEYGLEIARNKLISDSSYFADGNEVLLNGANVEVKEIRSEIFATFTYQASDKLSIEGGITSEFSQIEVSGEDANKQTFQFIKPRISSTYTLDENNQFSVLAERKVGQLNFRDFAASNDAADDTIFSGNPDLAPDTSDELSISYDLSFNERGSLKLKLFHHWQSDILEQVILPSGGQGLGNAGDARFWGIETNLNLPLNWVLEDGLIEISHGYRDSEFKDPITNKTRITSGYTHNWLSFKLRQDVVKSKVAWGLEYWGNFKDTFFTVSERVTFHGNKRLRIFLETSRYLNSKIKLEITHINTGEYTRSRFIHDGTRSEQFRRSEVAFRKREPEYRLSISSTF